MTEAAAGPERTEEELAALRRGYTPELWPVLERYGRDMVQFAMAVLATNEAIDTVIALGKANDRLRVAGMVLSNNMAGLCEWICGKEGWDFNGTIMACVMDVNRAKALAQPAPTTARH